MDTRIAITGVGAVSPAGRGARPFWRSLLAQDDLRGGWSRGELARYPVDAVIEIPEHALEAVGSRGGDRLVARLADHVVNRALDEAGLPFEDGRVGCILSTTTAGVDAFEGRLSEAAGRPDQGRAHDLDGAAILSAPGRPWRGPASMLSAACSSGLMAPALAADAIVTGEADAMVAGGVEVLLEYTVCGFAGLRLTTEDRCRPFSKERKGLVLSEGAVSFCLEPLSSALARGARVLGVILGYGTSCDADHVTAPNPDGVSRAMMEALRSSGVDPSLIGGVFAHGTGSQANDAVEIGALRRVLGGTATPPTTSIKSVMGHPQAAAGSFSLLAALMALDDGVLPPTSGVGEVDPALEGADIVISQSRRLSSKYLMVNAFGFGGNNCVMIVADLDTAMRS